MKRLALALMLLACDAPKPPAPAKPRPMTKAQTQLAQCRRLCDAGGLAIRRFVASKPPICECGAMADGPGPLEGVGLGIGLEVGRGLARELLR